MCICMLVAFAKALLLLGFNSVCSFCLLNFLHPNIFEDIGLNYFIFFLCFRISKISITDIIVVFKEYIGIS